MDLAKWIGLVIAFAFIMPGPMGSQKLLAGEKSIYSEMLRSGYAESAINECVKKQKERLKDKAIPPELAKQFCKCFIIGVADAITGDDLLTELRFGPKALNDKLRPRHVKIQNSCLKGILKNAQKNIQKTLDNLQNPIIKKDKQKISNKSPGPEVDLFTPPQEHWDNNILKYTPPSEVDFFAPSQ